MIQVDTKSPTQPTGSPKRHSLVFLRMEKQGFKLSSEPSDLTWPADGRLAAPSQEVAVTWACHPHLPPSSLCLDSFHLHGLLAVSLGSHPTPPASDCFMLLAIPFNLAQTQVLDWDLYLHIGFTFWLLWAGIPLDPQVCSSHRRVPTLLPPLRVGFEQRWSKV